MAHSTGAPAHNSDDWFGASFGLPPFIAWPAPTRPVFPVYPGCPPHCVGHADPSMLTTHDTHWEQFGPSGVVVSHAEGQGAMVSTADVSRALRTPEHTLLLVRELEMASWFALRLNATQPLTRPTA